MKIPEIEDRFKKTIDQYFAGTWMKSTNQTTHFIGGVLQSALHILPTDNYYNLKRYCYEKHGYDPGGVTDGQISITDILK